MNISAFKENVGKVVFEKFESAINRSHFTEENEQLRLEESASLVEEMPFVTMPLRDNGILTGSNVAHLIHVYQPNLWAQDYAYGNGSLQKMTVATAIERANASAEFKLDQSKHLRELIKKNGKNEWHFIDAMKKAALIESAFYTRISGKQIPKAIAKKIDIALMRRSLRNESMFKTILKHTGVDDTDALALLQIANDIDLSGCLTEISKLDPYFARRSGQIEGFSDINSEESAKLNTLKSEAFTSELIDRLYKKHPELFKKFTQGNLAFQL